MPSNGFRQRYTSRIQRDREGVRIDARERVTLAIRPRGHRRGVQQVARRRRTVELASTSDESTTSRHAIPLRWTRPQRQNIMESPSRSPHVTPQGRKVGAAWLPCDPALGLGNLEQEGRDPQAIHNGLTKTLLHNDHGAFKGMRAWWQESITVMSEEPVVTMSGTGSTALGFNMCRGIAGAGTNVTGLCVVRTLGRNGRRVVGPYDLSRFLRNRR